MTGLEPLLRWCLGSIAMRCDASSPTNPRQFDIFTHINHKYNQVKAGKKDSTLFSRLHADFGLQMQPRIPNIWSIHS